MNSRSNNPRDNFRKDPSYESFLGDFNDALKSLEIAGYRDYPEQYSTLHVVGVPRSGTTVLTQLIAAHLSVGCINNLIAAFWRAPVQGIQLSKKLLSGCETESDLISHFGRTKYIYEPHEFNYFWMERLGYPEFAQQPDGFEESIDWDFLRLVLLNMTHAYERPIVFKSFLLGFHAARMQKLLPKTCVIHIRRDPLENAFSLLRFREQMLGTLDAWVSLKPLEYESLKNEPFWYQVAGQVYYLEQALTRQIEAIGKRNVVEVTYDELCHSPRAVLERVRDLLAVNGQNVDIAGNVPAWLPRSRGQRYPDNVRRNVEDALNAFYRQDGRTVRPAANGVEVAARM